MHSFEEKILGERVRFYRRLHHRTQQECAVALAMSRSSYTLMELGRRSISAIELQKLARFLGIEVQHFYTQQHAEKETLPYQVL